MKPQRTRRLLAALGAAGLLLAFGWAFLPERVAVDVAAVARGPLVVTVDEEGRTRIKERYIVSAPLAGRLRRPELKAGDAVTAGGMVALIEPGDPDLLDPRTRAQAEARVRAAEAGHARLGPLVERAAIARDYAATELARAKDLFAHNGLSRQEYDAIERREADAAAEFREAVFQARVAEYELEAARAVLLGSGEEAEAGDRAFAVRAPVTGVVLRVVQESATVVAPGDHILELGDPADLEILVEVLSTDAVQIAPGAKVIVEHWGGAGDLAAVVRRVEPAGFTKISALGVEEQRINVLADFTSTPDQRRGVGDAFRVEVRIVLWESPEELKMPIAALFRQGREWAVFTLEGGRARLRTIEVGRRNDEEVQIVAGLAVGEEVILHPGDNLRDGARVRVR